MVKNNIQFFSTCRFPWMCGAYGVIGANENIPHAHLYVTVKNDAKESDIFDELRDAFNCKPNEYFELRREPKTVKKFKFLTQATSGVVLWLWKRKVSQIHYKHQMTSKRSNWDIRDINYVLF